MYVTFLLYVASAINGLQKLLLHVEDWVDDLLIDALEKEINSMND